MKKPAVYILASGRNGTLYVGVTSNLALRITQHKEKHAEGFTEKYAVDILVWYEYFETMEEAISAEKRMKNWKREWKIELIEKDNPYWNDLEV